MDIDIVYILLYQLLLLFDCHFDENDVHDAKIYMDHRFDCR